MPNVRHPVTFTEIARIKAPSVRSLVWSGDELVDWASGARRFHLDGTTAGPAVNYAYRFDAAVQSPSKEYVVIYERQGTKGLLLHQGQIVREINRSFYHAGAYEYPVTLGMLSNGREVLIHCPDDYNRIELEDAATGERLTRCEERKPMDFFHSRLQLNPPGTLLLSAGWVWHPCDMVAVFRLDEALNDPRKLDQSDAILQLGSEVNSATFLDERRLVVVTCSETFLDDEDFEDSKYLRPNSLAVWDSADRHIVSRVDISGPVGTLMPVDGEVIVDFYEHPKAIEISTGKVLTSLPELCTGKQTSSIIHHLEKLPPLALDPIGKRFAVAGKEYIHVVAIGGG